MRQEDNNTKSRKGKHLTYTERITIEVLLKEGYTSAEILKGTDEL